jgi:hypothetical protein
LARLLHPDHCTDDAVRRQAELQMRRLNGILEVLSDPLKRAAYDAAPAVPPAAHTASTPGIPWLWIGAGVLATLCAILPFVLWQRQISNGSKQNAGAMAAPPPEKPMLVKRAGRRTTKGRTAALPEPASDMPVMQGLPEVNTASLPEVQPVPIVPPISIPIPSPHESVPVLTGEWLYVPIVKAAQADLYPPEYIELRVSEDGGVVRGRYRARYSVAKHAISPNVSFEFQGRASDNLPWLGQDGAQGRVSLKLLAAGRLQVTWTTDRVGREMGLVAGTATLVRKVE